MSLPRDVRPGMQGFIPLHFDASLNPRASWPLSASNQSAFGKLPGRAAAPVRSLIWPAVMKKRSGGHRHPRRHAAGYSRRPLSGRSDGRAGRRPFRPQAGRRAMRLEMSCVDHHRLRNGASAASPSIIRAKTPCSRLRSDRWRTAAHLHRFQRLWSVLAGPYSLGASHPRKPLRLMKIMPLNTRRSSTRDLPWLLGGNGRSCAICASVSQKRWLIGQSPCRG